MLTENPVEWRDHLRSLNALFLECVMAVWPRCVERLPDNPSEDTITLNLVEFLLSDPVARNLFVYLAYQHEVRGLKDGGEVYSKGRIDMALLLNQAGSNYLAYECKRLNVDQQNGKKRSLATPYVLDGVCRFTTEQYAAGIPLACMLGYVLDGNVNSARTKVWAAINKLKAEVDLVGSLQVGKAIGTIERFSSVHRRGATGLDIEIGHALLPFPTS